MVEEKEVGKEERDSEPVGDDDSSDDSLGNDNEEEEEEAKEEPISEVRSIFSFDQGFLSYL